MNICPSLQISYSKNVHLSKSGHVGALTILRRFGCDCKKHRLRCLRHRQRQPTPVHAGLPNARQRDLSDRACVARPGASPARSRDVPSCSRAGLVTGRERMHDPKGLFNAHAASLCAPAHDAAVGDESILSEASSPSPPN